MYSAYSAKGYDALFRPLSLAAILVPRQDPKGTLRRPTLLAFPTRAREVTCRPS